MKAIVKTEKQEKSLGLFDVEIPGVKDDEVLVKIRKTAICGTDLHVYEYSAGYEFIQTPVILGHEFSGVVEKVGKNVTNYKIGERVMGESNRYCRVCKNCKIGLTDICLNSKMTGLHFNGAMAEYIAVPEYTLHHLPNEVSFEEGAVAQPISVSLNAVFDHCPIVPGDRVVVFGPGIQGLIAAQAALLKGAAKVAIIGTDLDEESRLPIAREMNFLAINSSKEDVKKQLEIHWGSSEVDVVLEASGAIPAVETGITILKRGGILTVFGIYSKPLNLDLTKLVRAEITLYTSYTSTWKHYEQALTLLAEGKLNIKPFITEYPFSDGIQAFEDGVSKKAIKPVLTF
ncbi:zinc-dependent alcohol dehydrogenase [Ureibacillus endophyticus]|uniref:Enoyl reductase (ER) domain-containing protein n=1 Tax=Ureibacillus endophyticus TaxID=1978490 RepID=A0A494YT19_9BACL|nr:alcohol dehydrogenase catalytic domain-containing protein [Lysinibacillus endophyticus]RKQ13236.1 hypothetical protein D8M03_16460 [Lysinibacillus endophyticus]